MSRYLVSCVYDISIEQMRELEKRIDVFFKDGLSEAERTFDFAHECGHRINHDPTPQTRPDGYNKPERDQLADYVGAALLMPIETVYSYLIENNYKEASVTKKGALIRELCAKHGVSEMIALRRVKEVYILKQHVM